MCKTLIIAEVGVNHNGKLDLALQLCDAAKDAGADIVKFQTWKTDLVITRKTGLAKYQSDNMKCKGDQYDMLRELELSYDAFVEIKKYCDRIGIQFLSTADEEESLDFLIELGIPYMKLGSGDITNIPYLRKVASKGLPILLSTGMSTLGDVELAYNILKISCKEGVSLLHCTTNYPCPMNEVNLRAMQTLKEAFKCRVGYSDHTMGIGVAIAAVAMGAEIIEKHFTLDTRMVGPDHKSSLETRDFKRMVNSIRDIEQALGTGIKEPNKSEKDISEVVLKRIVAKKEIKKGEILSEENMTVKRSFGGLSAAYWDILVGVRAPDNFCVDQPIKLK